MCAAGAKLLFCSFKPIAFYKVLVAVAVVVGTLQSHDGDGKTTPLYVQNPIFCTFLCLPYTTTT